nr:zinc finger protein 271-like [Lytechinus pictus]
MDYNYLNQPGNPSQHHHPVTEYMHPSTAHSQHVLYQQSLLPHQMPYPGGMLPPEFRGVGGGPDQCSQVAEVARNENVVTMVSVSEQDVHTTLLQMQNALSGNSTIGYNTQTSAGHPHTSRSPPNRPRTQPTQAMGTAAQRTATIQPQAAPAEEQSAPQNLVASEQPEATVELQGTGNEGEEPEEPPLGGPLPEGLAYRKLGPKTICVVADREIPAGVRFGPFKGSFGKGPIHFNNILSWEMTLEGRVVGFLSPVKGDKAWTTKVRAAQHLGELTAEADQYNGRIYFTTIKELQPGEEFKVFYSADYRESCGFKIGLHDLKYNQESKGFECIFCPCHCSNPKSLLRHMKLFHHKDKRPEIDVEVQQMNEDRDSSEERDDRDVPIGEGEEDVIGVSSGKRFPSEGPLIIHENFHQKLGIVGNAGGEAGNMEDCLTCEKCGFICPDKAALENHVLGHKKAPFGCDECGRVFMSHQGLTGHKRTDHGTASKDRLKIKLRVRRNGSGRNFCKTCGYTCAGPKEYQSHINGHKQYPFGCPECGCLYEQKTALLVHLKERHSTTSGKGQPILMSLKTKGGDKLRCSKCGFNCPNENSFNVHMKNHDKAPYGCDICGLMYTQKQFVMRHKRAKHGIPTPEKPVYMRLSPPFSCTDCNKTYVNPKSFMKHQKEKHGWPADPQDKLGSANVQRPGDFECDLCPETFSTPTAFNSHLQEAHGIEPHPSDLKKGGSKRRNSAAQPPGTSGSSKDTQGSVLGSTRCYICGKTFIKYSFLHDHLRQHHGIEPLTRGGSQGAETSQANQNEEQNGAPPAEEQDKGEQIDMLGKPMDYYNRPRPFKCKHCPRRFVYRHRLRRHEYKVHLGGAKFSCSFCTKGFDMESQLLVHVQKHTNNRPFKCTLCTKSFASQSALDNHQKEHTGEKPHKCDVCERGFGTRKLMTKHKLRVHSNKEKKFVCSFCGKRFLAGKDHKIHERRHKGIRPFVCLSCGRAFKDKHCRDVHMRIHTGEKPYVCKQCGKAFPLPHRLTDHIVMHQKENMEQQAAAAAEAASTLTNLPVQP